MISRRRQSPTRHQRLDDCNETNEVSEALHHMKKSTIPRFNPKKYQFTSQKPSQHNMTNRNGPIASHKSCFSSVIKSKNFALDENRSPFNSGLSVHTTRSGVQDDNNDEDSGKWSPSKSLSKIPFSQQLKPHSQDGNLTFGEMSIKNQRTMESFDSSDAAQSESSASYSDYNYANRHSTNYIEMNITTGSVNQVTSQQVLSTKSTPKSLLRNWPSSMKNSTSQRRQHPMNSNSSHNTSRKKIQWDESILNHTRDIMDDQESGVDFASSRSPPKKFLNYNASSKQTCRAQNLILRSKRFDECFQHDIQQLRRNYHDDDHVNQPVSSPDGAYLDTSTNDDNSSSHYTSSTGSDTTSSKSSIHLNSKDTTSTQDEIEECINDILDQTMAATPVAKNSRKWFQSRQNLGGGDQNEFQRKLHLSNHSELSNVTNVSAEIAECVTDINDQTIASGVINEYEQLMSSFHNRKTPRSNMSEVSYSTNVTAEIVECVADIKDQTMAINEDMVSTRKFSYRNVLSNVSDVSSTNVTAQIAECVADVNNQSMAMSPIQIPNVKSTEQSSRMNNTTTEIAECVADVMEQSMATNHQNVSNSLTGIKRCPALDISSIYANPDETLRDLDHRQSNNGSPIFQDCVQYEESQNTTTSSRSVSDEKRMKTALQLKERSPLGNLDINKRVENSMDSNRDNMPHALRVQNKLPFSPIFVLNSRQMSGCDQSITPSLDASSVSSSSTNSSYSRKKKPEQIESHPNEPTSKIMQVVNQLHLLSPPPNSSQKDESENDDLSESSQSSSSSDSSIYVSCESFEMHNRSDHSSGERSPDVSANLIKIGISLLHSEQYEESILTFNEALRIRQKKYGDNHPLVAKIHNNLGVAYLHLKRYDRGLLSFQNALNSHNNSLQIILSIGDKNNIGLVRKFDLEIVEMLKNLGSVCLDWLDKDPTATTNEEKLNLAEKAEHAFRRGLTIQLHYLDTFDSSVKETIKMCEEAKNLCTYFNEGQVSRESCTIKECRQTDVDGSECSVPFDENTRVQKKTSTNVTSTNVTSTQQFIGNVSDQNHPYDERTFREYPSDEFPRLQTSLIPSPVPHYLHKDSQFSSSNWKASNVSASFSPNHTSSMLDTKLSLFSHGGPCQMRIIDSDIKEEDEEEEKEECNASNSKSSMIYDDFPHAVMTEQAPFSPMISPLATEQEQSKVCIETNSSSISMKGSVHNITNATEDGKNLEQSQIQRDDVDNLNIIPRTDEEFQQEPHLHSNKGSDDQPLRHHESKRQGAKEGLNLGHEESVYNVTISDINVARTSINVETLLDQDEEIAPSDKTNIIRENLSEETILSDPRKYHHELHNAAVRCLKAGQHEKSKALFNTLLSTYKSIHGELHRTIGSTYHNIGIVLLRSEEYEEALESFQKASRVRKGSIGRDHADVAVSLVKVGITQLLLKRFDEALLTFREALSIRRHALGHLHPTTARIYNNIGCVHVEFNEMREARRAFEAALDVQRNSLCYEPNSGQLQFGTATTLCNLGYLYTYRGMHEKACLVLKEAAQLQEQVVGPSHPTVLSTLDALADSYGKYGDNINAMTCYKDIIGKLETREKNDCKLSTRKRRALAIVHYKVSRMHRKQNDLQAALRTLTESWCLVNEIGSPELLSRIRNEIDEVKADLKKTNMDWL